MKYLEFAERTEEQDLAPWASKSEVMGWIIALMEEMRKTELVCLYERILNKGGE